MKILSELIVNLLWSQNIRYEKLNYSALNLKIAYNQFLGWKHKISIFLALTMTLVVSEGSSSQLVLLWILSI
jgi:hypothetical protein